MFQCDLTEPLVRLVLREIGGPSGEWDNVLTELLNVPFPEMENAGQFSTAYLRYNLMRKWGGDVPVKVDREATAYAAFLEAEEKCAAWNLDRGASYDRELDSGYPLTQSLNALFWKAKEKIATVLGPFDLDEAANLVRYTSGASTRCTRRSGHPFFKYQGRPEVTPSCAMLMICDLWRTPVLRERLQDRSWDPTLWVKRVAGSHLAFVPKTWKTDRTICLEPEGNMRWQCAIGSMIRKRLKWRTGTRTGFGYSAAQDLDDQGPNASLANIGSYTGMLSTIDLSAASDSVSLGLVEELLPPDWFRFIQMTRSAYCRHPDGTYRKLHKVSSMGNGFTFELESLIFWALTSSTVELLGVSDRRLRVYGDDIIVSTEAAPRLIQLLEFCGFSTNVDKTFVSGPFRESCGSHWFEGVDVSPFHIKEPISTEDRYYWFLNSYRHWLVLNGRKLSTYHQAVRLVEKTVRRLCGKDLCVVPPGFGFTAGLEVPASRARIWFSLRKQGYVFTALLPRRKRYRPNGYSAYLVGLESAGSTVYENPIAWGNLRSLGLVINEGDVSYSRRTRTTSVWVF